MAKRQSKAKASPRSDFAKVQSDNRLTQTATARLIGITTATLRAWTHKGLFPKPKRYGAKLLGYALSEVKAWARANGITLQAA